MPSSNPEVSKKWRENNKDRLASNQRKYRARRLLKNPSYEKEFALRWRTENPEKYLFQTVKGRAKARKLDFSLCLEDIVIPDVCPVFGIPLYFQYDDKRNANSPSVDRIDSSKGYIKGNIQIISWRANNLKRDGTLEEFEKLTEFLRGEKKRL